MCQGKEAEPLEATIIIPNYNGKEMLENCIATLEKQTCKEFKVLVIDNGSTDGSTRVTSSLPAFEMIALPENTGFCKAVNIGIQLTKTPYFILLNNDTEAEEHFVEELLKAVGQSEDIFSCGAQMIDYRNRDLIDNAGDYYLLTGWARARGKGKPAADFEKPCEVFSCCAGASIYRTEVIQKIGMFDERHFAYLEDVDIGYRAKIYGYRNCYAPKAKVYHLGSATTGTRYNKTKVFLAARNSMYVIYKNMPLPQIVFNFPFLFGGVLIKTLFFVKKGFAGAYLKGIKEGFLAPRKCRKVRFKREHLGNYIRIEKELARNIVHLFSSGK